MNACIYYGCVSECVRVYYNVATGVRVCKMRAKTKKVLPLRQMRFPRNVCYLAWHNNTSENLSNGTHVEYDGAICVRFDRRVNFTLYEYIKIVYDERWPALVAHIHTPTNKHLHTVC